MLRRFMNVMRSFFGLFLRSAENPELLLEQYIDDMENQIPLMNANASEVVKQEIMLKGQVEKLRKQIAELDKKVINAIKLGPQYENEAKLMISEMEQAKLDLARNESLLQTAAAASQKAKAARDDYERQMKLRIQEAKSKISQAKQAQVTERLAGMMMSFQAGDNTDTLERMGEKIDERMAGAQARMELATNSVDSRMRDIERHSAEASVDSTLDEYKRQLGMLPAEEEAAPRTMTPVTEPPQTS